MKDRKDKERIAIALGFYAKATRPDLKSLQEACEEFGLTAWMNDIDCQVAFRKGFEEAAEMNEDNGGGCSEKHFHELNRMQKVIFAEVLSARNDLAKLLGHSPNSPSSRGGSGPVKVGGWPVSEKIIGGGGGIGAGNSGGGTGGRGGPLVAYARGDGGGGGAWHSGDGQRGGGGYPVAGDAVYVNAGGGCAPYPDKTIVMDRPTEEQRAEIDEMIDDLRSRTFG
jgi:hypothetical protein